MGRFANRVVVVCVGVSVLLTTSCAPTLVDRVKAFENVHNSGNVEREMSFFADDVTFEIVGFQATEGKEQLRRLVNRQAMFNSRMALRDCQESGDTVTCKIIEQNDLLRVAGIGPLYYDSAEYVFEKGEIRAVRAKLAESSGKLTRRFWESFSKWASANRAQEWNALRSESTTEESVGKLLVLAREWREAMERERQ